MTKLKIIGAACLVAALAAASPAMARGGHMGAGTWSWSHGRPAFMAGRTLRAADFATAASGLASRPGVVAGAALGGLGYGYYGDSYAYDYGDNYAPAPYYYEQ